MRIATQGWMLLTSPGPERVQTMVCGRAECLSGLTFSSCDPHKSNVTDFLRCVRPSVRRTYFAPQSSMKAEQIQLAYAQPIRCFSPSLLVLDDVHAPNVS